MGLDGVKALALKVWISSSDGLSTSSEGMFQGKQTIGVARRVRMNNNIIRKDTTKSTERIVRVIEKVGNTNDYQQQTSY